MIDIALGSAALGDSDWREALATTSRLGFVGFDLQIDSTLPFGRSLYSATDGDQLSAELRTRGVRPACVSNVRDVELLLGPHTFHTDSVQQGSPADKIAHARRHARRTIDLAARLDVGFVRFFFGCADHLLMFPWHGLERGWQTNVDMLADRSAELFEYATANGVTICLEPHPRQTVYDLPSLNHFRELMGSRGFRVGLCFDPANVLAGGLDPLAYVRALDLAPEFVHLKDVERWVAASSPKGAGWKRYGPGPHIRFRNAGLGELQWPRIRDALYDLGFDGTVVVEFEDLLVSRATGLAHALQFARRLFDLDSGDAEGQWW